MKYLKDYVLEPLKKALREHGAFLVLCPEDFLSQAKEGVSYVSIGHGLLCPIETAQILRLEIEQITMEAIDKDLAENGKEKIIRRELIVHQSWLTGTIRDCVRSLKDYPISTKQILDEFVKGSSSEN